MDKNPFDIVDTMKVKNGIQMDGTHKIDNDETDFDDLSSYWETNNQFLKRTPWKTVTSFKS